MNLSKAAINSLGLNIFTLDKNYCYTSFTELHSKTMKAIWGKEICEGMCMIDYIQEPDKQKAKSNFDRVLAGEHLMLIEEYGDINLNRSYWENRYEPIINEKTGIIDEIVIFVSDVSKYMTLTKKLETITNRLDIALESGKIGVWEWDIKKNTIYWSDELYAIFNIDSKDFELTFENYLSLIHENDRQLLLDSIENSLKNQTSHYIEHRTYPINGQSKWIRGLGKLIFDKNNQPAHLIGTAQDITDEKNAALHLVENNLKLTKINQELDRFVYSASHDLRAPIASLLGLINVAKLEKRPEAIETLFNHQEKSLLKMDNFIQDIINFSRNARTEISSELIQFKEIIEDTFELLNYSDNLLKIKKVININLQSDFYSDKNRIQIIFNNLISNSIKYVKYGVESLIEISVKSHLEGIEIEVKDNGIGIPNHYKEKIFTMFFRASTQAKGSGIGLYIVKEVLEKLNGTISFESEAGEGTSFKIYIPNFKN